MFHFADMPHLVIRYGVGLWRRRGLIIALTWIVTLIGWGVVFALPDLYKSRAELNISTQTPLKNVIGTAGVGADDENWIRVLRQQLMSRENVTQVIYETGLDAVILNEVELERMIEELREGVKIVSPQSQYFVIEFLDPDPVIAQKVVDSVVNLFIEKGIGGSITATDTALEDLKVQISRLEDKLAAKDRAIAQYRQENASVLTDTGLLTQRIESRESDLIRVKNAIERIERDISNLRRRLAVTPRSEKDAEIEILKRQLTALRSQFNDNYPDIKNLTARIAEIETPASATELNPAYQQLSEQIKEIVAELDAYREQRDRMIKEVEELSVAVNRAPGVLTALQDLVRDYGSTEASYKQLLLSLNRMEITAGLNASGNNVSYEVFERPKVAAQPSSPNRGVLTLVSAALGIMSGFGISVLLVSIDSTFTQRSDIEEVLKMPVLGSVSLSPASTLRKRRFYFNSGLLCCSAIFIVVVSGKFIWHLGSIPEQPSAATVALSGGGQDS